MIKYFHELTKDEFNKLVDDKNYTWAQLEKDYPQPEWCTYPEATAGMMGCWSLTSFDDATGKNWVTEKYCKTCDLYKEKL